MPELPEVETICRGLRPLVVDRSVEEILCSGKSLRHPIPQLLMTEQLPGHRIVGLERRAKYLLLRFDHDALLIIHLGMTGNLGIFSPDAIPARHCHVRFRLSDGLELRYTDPRRFGAISLLLCEEIGDLESTFFKTTGPEPFSEAFNAKYLQELARGRSLPVKSLLMTNQVVAGIGNIYANESLFAAGILPGRQAQKVTMLQWQRLVEAARTVLHHAIACGGSTISDFRNANQQSGYFQMNFQVYGRQGQPCPRCGQPIDKVQIGGRASYFCNGCQS